MELRQLKYFVEVARLGSFSMASKALFITQSTISQQINKLEEELGVKLLSRDTRHVVLSDYGEQFFSSAVQVLEEAEAGVERLRNVNELKVGTLSIGATYSFGPLLKRTVQDFYKQYPHIRLNIVITSKEELRQKLLERELDLLLTYKSPLGDDRIESHFLFQSRLCLIGRIDEMRSAGKEVSVKELSRFPLALPARGLQARDTLEDVLFAQNADLDIRLEINSVRSLLDLVAGTPLVTILSEESLQQVQGFRAVPIAHPGGRMDGCYHLLKGTRQKMAVQRFIELLKENNSFNQAFVL